MHNILIHAYTHFHSFRQCTMIIAAQIKIREEKYSKSQNFYEMYTLIKIIVYGKR